MNKMSTIYDVHPGKYVIGCPYDEMYDSVYRAVIVPMQDGLYHQDTNLIIVNTYEQFDYFGVNRGKDESYIIDRPEDSKLALMSATYVTPEFQHWTFLCEKPSKLEVSESGMTLTCDGEMLMDVQIVCEPDETDEQMYVREYANIGVHY